MSAYLKTLFCWPYFIVYFVYLFIFSGRSWLISVLFIHKYFIPFGWKSILPTSYVSPMPQTYWHTPTDPIPYCSTKVYIPIKTHDIVKLIFFAWSEFDPAIGKIRTSRGQEGNFRTIKEHKRCPFRRARKLIVSGLRIFSPGNSIMFYWGKKKSWANWWKLSAYLKKNNN